MASDSPELPLIARHRRRAMWFYWLWLPGLVIGSGLAFDALFSWPRFSAGTATLCLAWILMGIGLILISWSTRDLASMGLGTPSPARPCQCLVTTGSYRICRHPMFLGYDLAAFATLLFIGSPSALLLSYPIMLGWQIRFLGREERILSLRFGDEYQNYRERTPFLFPFSFWPQHPR